MCYLRVTCALLIWAVYANAQTLTPREIFYGQGRTAPAQKTTAKAKPAPRKTAPTPMDGAMSASTAATAAPVESQAEVPVVSLVSEKIAPLGLKYSVLKRDPEGKYAEVDPDASFTAGDHIKVHVEVNDHGYLYVVAQGSSGIWKVLYPSRELSGGDNRVHEGKTYSIPSEGVFTFDTHAGTEKLFVILSRQPEQDLETLIYSLRDKPPADKHSSGDLSRPMMAANIGPVQDDLVQHLRQTYSRDLVIEKVDDAKGPPSSEVEQIELAHGAVIPPGEKAVYVVNRNANENSRVVADVSLHHQ